MTKPVWHWNSNSNPWGPNQQPHWIKYSNMENEIIEEAFQQNKKFVELNSHIIDLDKKVQIKKTDNNKQRPIKRILIESDENIRERFIIPPKLTTTFTDYSHTTTKFISQWIMKNFHIQDNIKKIVEEAINGIRHEGDASQQENEVQLITKQLMEVTNKTEKEICECCVHLYTLDTFLYKSLNRALREDDMTKIVSLGPFCYLLYKSSSILTKNLYHGFVYRGTNLDSDMIGSYRKALNGGCRSWSGFTSTSTNRETAEQFGNVLFVIQILRDDTAINVSSLSKFPNEEEVLIKAGWNFTITDIESGHNGKVIVYIKQD